MSLTISGLLTTILALALGDAEVASELVSDSMTIIGIFMTWYGRYRHADIHWYGQKK